jgi:hypothetical protein
MGLREDTEALLLRLHRWELARQVDGAAQGFFEPKSACEELAWTPEQFNRALSLLENRGYVKVMKSLGTAPFLVRGFQLTEEGFLEAEEQTPDDETHEPVPKSRDTGSSPHDLTSNERNGTVATTRLKLFVSHSSADRDAAGALVEFVRAALSISARDIRCTSVDGYKLDAGATADEQLRAEIFDCDAFVALLSPASLHSVYVMFELGARWGAKRPLAPIMINGVVPGDLKAPLSAIHAVSGTSEADMHQLVATLSRQLSIAPEPASAYLKAMNHFIGAAKPPP